MAYVCRLCPATTFRKVRRRSADGGPELYRCSGCGVVFANPDNWRKHGPVEPVKPATPVVDETPGLFARYGYTPERWGPQESEEELREIREAAARANKSKGRRW